MPKQSDRAFGITFALLFGAIFGVGWIAFDVQLEWALLVTASLLACATICPGILLPFNRLWHWLAGKLAIFNNYLLLGAFFYIVVTPLGIVARLFGWDAMARRRRPPGETYWSPVHRQTDAETLRDMF